MRSARCCLLLASSLLLSFPLHAQSSTGYSDNPNWRQVCAQAVTVPLPAEVLTPKTATAPDCNPVALYYGFQQAPDYSAALACAARQHAKEGSISDIGSAGILAELYANGYGVPKNLPLALRFSCELDNMAAQAETASRVGHIEAMESGKLPASKRFDLCDDATSGMMTGWCASVDEGVADYSRAHRIAVVRGKLPRAAQDRLPELQTAEAGFENARVHGENQGGGGSGSAGFALIDQNLLREQFVRNLENFAAGRAPRATPTLRSTAQAQLDKAAKDAATLPDLPGSYTHEGLIATQQAWQQLFDAWMRFVPVAFPHLPPDDAATELLRLRIHQLKKL
ncbi:hypothetical protein [Silvibacterium sp.]|uniref:hypothetical protein n=1 Tax=Silvibacterium sp. TaxID=1964179 RepID=UPI0039E67044